MGKLDSNLQSASKSLWSGPSGEGWNGGVTFSMLSRWLACRERFRLYAIEGLRPFDGFNVPLHFGSMWHVCEEWAAKATKSSMTNLWQAHLKEYAFQLAEQYPNSVDKVDHWYNVIKVQFPEYVKYWSSHEDMKNRKPLLQEQAFDVPYKLPSGRVIRLRGKWDSVDLVGDGIVLMENKTKSEIDSVQLERQLKFDLQTMLYLVALDYYAHSGAKPFKKVGDSCGGNCGLIVGVRYNVIRRDCPIRQHKATSKKPAETKEHFYNRLKEDYFQAEPGHWFHRFNCKVSQQDIQKFRETCLDPILENVCCWYNEVVGIPNHPDDAPPANWVHPYGIRNMINEGYEGSYDHCIETGSRVGLVKMEKLFEELQ